MSKKIKKMANYYKDVFNKKMKVKNAYLSKLRIKDLEKNELINLNNNIEYMIKMIIFILYLTLLVYRRNLKVIIIIVHYS
ncbi:hypothetical protein [Aliarcobacter faecis]|uniref:hypothetical protein n=1 Tax=Aliarcobacter faecis TaxID=1564138 RepID=UPI00047CA373|nr:hypothetical protein [Aliarcobacter faecis]